MKRFIFPGFLFLVLATFFIFGRKFTVKEESNNSIAVVTPLEAVAALGQLSPAGEIRKLAAPSSGLGGSPRIKELLVKEGDQVKEGELLAVFDNNPKILADLQISRARLETINKKVTFQERELKRYRESVLQGGSPEILLAEKNDFLIELLGLKKEVSAEIKSLEVDLFNSKLISPIDGTILKVNSREGERPGLEGVLQVGSNQNMEALIEVYESDISRIFLGQNVSLSSENGGFNGTLKGHVSQISPRVSQRVVLSTDPTGDADSRIVEVRVVLDLNSALIVNRFTGMKLIARFQPF